MTEEPSCLSIKLHDWDSTGDMYRLLVENSLGLVCAHNLSGDLLTVNVEAARALGYAPQELIGRPLPDFLDAAVRPVFARYMRHIERAGKASGELRLVRRDGVILTWTYRNALYSVPGSAPIIIGHAIDVTRHRELQNNLRESNEQYRLLFDEAPVAYHEIDSAGIVVRVNRAECQLLGRTREEIVGRPVWELTSSGQRVASESQVKRKLRGDQLLVPFFREYSRKNGEKLTLLIHENLIRARSGEIIGIRSTLLDVTEQHRAEAELRRVNTELDARIASRTAELEISNRRLSEFVHMVSHDLQEPLRSTSAFSALLQRHHSDRLNDEGREFLQHVVSSAARMSRLVQDLLTYSRYTGTERPATALDLNLALDGALANLREALDRSNADVAREPLPTVVAEFTPMMQLFQNLIDNALKYRSQLPPSISISSRQDGDEFIISIVDNGIGVPESERERVFGLFKRSQFSDNGPLGSGLGLAICKSIVERHNGRIWIESSPCQGCTVKFTLSARPAHVPYA